MRTSYFFLLFALLSTLFFNSCIEEPRSDSQQVGYFQLHNFLEEQIAYLDSIQPSVIKENKHKEGNQTQEFKIKDWRKELKLIREVHINRPIYEGLYSVDTLEQNAGLIRYQAQDPNLSTRQIDIRRNSRGDIQEVTIQFKNQNWFYGSGRNMKLFFVSSPSSKPRLQRYRVQGFQNTLLGEAQEYDIRGEIQWEED